jgi:hypothetical protein
VQEFDFDLEIRRARRLARLRGFIYRPGNGDCWFEGLAEFLFVALIIYIVFALASYLVGLGLSRLFSFDRLVAVGVGLLAPLLPFGYLAWRWFKDPPGHHAVICEFEARLDWHEGKARRCLVDAYRMAIADANAIADQQSLSREDMDILRLAEQEVETLRRALDLRQKRFAAIRRTLLKKANESLTA